MTGATFTAALGWIGSGLLVVSLTQRDLRRLRAINLAASLVLLAFNLTIGLGSMIALNIVLAVVNGYWLIADGRTTPVRARRRVLAHLRLFRRRLSTQLAVMIGGANS